MEDFSLGGETVLVRLDLNSPLDPITGRILSDSRFRAHMTTLRELRDARTVLLAHQGRPGKDDFTPMAAHADRLAYYLGRDVQYVDSLIGREALDAVQALNTGEFLLLENVRFYAEEMVLQDGSLDKMAASRMVTALSPLVDVFVNDAFAAAHRSQPSLVGFCERVPSAAGRLMEGEVRVLERALRGDDRPKVAVLGGVKVDDSIEVARHMLGRDLVDRVLMTGAVANLALWASGNRLGEPTESFLEREVPACAAVREEAARLLKAHGERVLLPEDLVLNVDGARKGVSVAQLPADAPIADVGLDTIVRFLEVLDDAAVILLNGPAGIFEVEAFSVGTRELLLGVARAPGFTVVGGGHTVTAVEQLGLTEQMDHVSTGGGALMCYLAGRPLPVLDALRRSKVKFAHESKGH